LSEETLGQSTLAEILSQPEAWMDALLQAETVAKELRRALYDLDEVVFCGCGSAYNAALAAAPIYRQLTLGRARAVQAGDLTFFPQATLPDPPGTLLVALSRSGETTETLQGAKHAQAEGAKVLAITCNAQSQLAQMADFAVTLERAVERSVTPTRSFTAMVVACQALAGHAAQDTEFLGQLAALVPKGQQLIENYGTLGELLATEDRYERFDFAGDAHCYALACECQLTVKEATRTPSRAYRVLEYRHGPAALVDEAVHLSLLATDSGQEQEHAFLADLKEREASLLLLCESTEHPAVEIADEVVDVQSGGNEFARVVLYMPVLQLLAAHRSILMGLNPDAPDEQPNQVSAED